MYRFGTVDLRNRTIEKLFFNQAKELTMKSCNPDQIIPPKPRFTLNI